MGVAVGGTVGDGKYVTPGITDNPLTLGVAGALHPARTALTASAAKILFCFIKMPASITGISHPANYLHDFTSQIKFN